jgi:hypothetical protein
LYSDADVNGLQTKVSHFNHTLFSSSDNIHKTHYLYKSEYIEK